MEQPVPMQQYQDRLQQFAMRIEPTLPGLFDTLNKMNILAVQSKQQLFGNQVHDYIEGIIKRLRDIQPMKIGGKKKKTLRRKRL